MTVISMLRRHIPSAIAIIPLLTVAALPVRADHADKDIANFASNTGAIVYIAGGAALPLVTDGRRGKEHTLRAVDAVGTTLLLTDGLKAITKEKRPDSNEHDSFPSGHASTAFALATMQSQFHPRQAPLWFAGAALISASRLTLHKHTFGDVAAGAVLGYATARLELSLPRGLILAPFIPAHTKGGGLKVGISF